MAQQRLGIMALLFIKFVMVSSIARSLQQWDRECGYRADRAIMTSELF